eukprot:gene12878-14204_t
MKNKLFIIVLSFSVLVNSLPIEDEYTEYNDADEADEKRGKIAKKKPHKPHKKHFLGGLYDYHPLQGIGHEHWIHGQPHYHYPNYHWDHWHPETDYYGYHGTYHHHYPAHHHYHDGRVYGFHAPASSYWYPYHWPSYLPAPFPFYSADGTTAGQNSTKTSKGSADDDCDEKIAKKKANDALESALSAAYKAEEAKQNAEDAQATAEKAKTDATSATSSSGNRDDLPAAHAEADQALKQAAEVDRKVTESRDKANEALRLAAAANLCALEMEGRLSKLIRSLEQGEKSSEEKKNTGDDVDEDKLKEAKEKKKIVDEALEMIQQTEEKVTSAKSAANNAATTIADAKSKANDAKGMSR